MQTHDDADAPRMSKKLREMFLGEGADTDAEERLARLQQRATKMLERGESSLTVGRPGESTLKEAIKYGVTLRRLPPDPDCLRISVGEVIGIPEGRYLVFRGDPKACLAILERAARALRDSLDKMKD